MASRSEDNPSQNGLQRLDSSKPHRFLQPSKKIHEGQDVSQFLVSRAYNDVMTFLMQLNHAMVPSKLQISDQKEKIQTWPLGSPEVHFSETVLKLQELLAKIGSIIDEAPPDTGPRRFGNISFRKWYQLVEERVATLMSEFLPKEVLLFKPDVSGEYDAGTELKAYLLGSFGSAQRLDYGTGHELSFLAFLGCIWKLGGFAQSEDGDEERGIVLGVVEPYLNLVRRLIKTYNLEPAGSHGVWGLDDHSFIPYIFGSAQNSPAITPEDRTPIEGSLLDAPDPAGVAKDTIVARERTTNMYFSAVGFIHDVKRGPFWEHSPMLYDISGIKAGWGKINKGMLKMYNAEVLSKFPVVQHFPFGSLFSWDRDPDAIDPPSTIHMTNQPYRTTQDTTAPPPPTVRPTAPVASGAGMKAPWANNPATSNYPVTATRTPYMPQPPLRNINDNTSSTTTAKPAPHPSSLPQTSAPWATHSSNVSSIPPPSTTAATKATPTRRPPGSLPLDPEPIPSSTDQSQVTGFTPTGAPWANGRPGPDPSKILAGKRGSALGGIGEESEKKNAG